MEHIISSLVICIMINTWGLWRPTYKDMISFVIHVSILKITAPDNKIHEANMGPVWGRQDPGGSHVGPMNFTIWVRQFYFENADILVSHD